MKNNFITLIFIFLTCSAFSQAVGYDVFGTQTNPRRGPYSLLTLDTLQEAKTLKDINARYRPSWVATYLSVEIASNCQGMVKKAVSSSDTLTQEQMDILKKADLGCSIEVVVDYIPENNLKYNPPRQMSFSLTPIPIFEAKYPGGYPQLKAYLKENIIDELPRAMVEQVALVKVRFNISDEGQVDDAQIFETSNDDKIDQLILKAICNMPRWTPAENSKGIKITQEFEFTMGTILLRCDYVY